MFVGALRNSTCLLDASKQYQSHFQDPATPIMEGIVYFYGNVLFIIIICLTFTVVMTVRTLFLFRKDASEVHKKVGTFCYGVSKVAYGSKLEIVWTFIPVGLMIFMGIPSFSLLYSMDEIVEPSVSVKIIGHQWFWQYEYDDYFLTKIKPSFQFDSYMLREADLRPGKLRLLDTNTRLFLPEQTHIRLLITSVDVVHSFAVPSFGIKLDACPGRLNQTAVYICRSGKFYGQCSEMCGLLHGFMPISVRVVSPLKFLEGMRSVIGKA